MNNVAYIISMRMHENLGEGFWNNYKIADPVKFGITYSIGNAMWGIKTLARNNMNKTIGDVYGK